MEKDCQVDWQRVLAEMGRMSFAEAVRVADEAVKERIIEGLPRVDTALMLRAIADRAQQIRTPNR